MVNGLSHLVFNTAGSMWGDDRSGVHTGEGDNLAHGNDHDNGRLGGNRLPCSHPIYFLAWSSVGAYYSQAT